MFIERHHIQEARDLHRQIGFWLSEAEGAVPLRDRYARESFQMAQAAAGKLRCMLGTNAARTGARTGP